MAVFFACLPSARKNSAFTSRFSMRASTTRSQSASAAGFSAAISTLATFLATSSALILPFFTARSYFAVSFFGAASANLASGACPTTR